MSEAPRYQLAMFGAAPEIVVEAAKVVAELREKPARAAVSADRAMRAAQVTMAGVEMDPPDIKGWRDDLAAVAEGRPGFERPRIGADGVCTAIERWRRLEDGTIGPCPWLGCPRHNVLDYGAPIAINGRRHAEIRLNRAGEEPAMGRRDGLSTVPSDGEADDFALEALTRLDAIPETCTKDAGDRLRSAPNLLDVEETLGGVEAEAEEDRAELERAAREAWRVREDAVRVREIAGILGVSEEQIRLDTLSAARKLGVRMVNGQPRPGDGARIEAMMALRYGQRRIASDGEIQERAERVLAFLGRGEAPRGVQASAAAVDRALLAAREAPPIVIRRIERDAPPPRVPTADEIFPY